MISRKNRIYLIVFIFSLFLLSPIIAEETSPRNTVEILLNSISTIKTEKPLSLEEIQENNVLSTRALARLDMVEISRKALGKYWEKRTSAEQKVFTDLLSLMFIKEAFPNSGKFFSSFKLIYGQTITNKSQATVPLKVIHEKEGEIYIDFHLYKNAVQWQVIDVDLDKISMRNNLRSQFYKVISTKNYQELVRRMEKKLASTNG
ncbi:MAG: ABC transporter substrate-binding protein [Nitrospina sp.]|jgi:phospholipid transport system substrate-binding protein|nr:ABC transporter substrate-binding protein [Nitrospina sp.]MBT6601233.1 ABC transporter substrate-binding protein [Nitrospina sp.]